MIMGHKYLKLVVRLNPKYIYKRICYLVILLSILQIPIIYGKFRVGMHSVSGITDDNTEGTIKLLFLHLKQVTPDTVESNIVAQYLTANIYSQILCVLTFNLNK